MTGDRSINISGGTYNEYIQGDAINVQGNYINVQGDFINLNQDLPQIDAQIQKRLIQFQSQGDSPEAAQEKVAGQLANQAKNQPATKHRLTELGKFIGKAAASGLIGEATLTVLKTALRLVGIPL